MLFYKLRKKTHNVGTDEKGEFFEIETIKGENISEDAFLELSNGRGEDDVE